MSMSTTNKLVAQCWRTGCELWIKTKANTPSTLTVPLATQHTETLAKPGGIYWQLLVSTWGNPCRKSPGLRFWPRFTFYEDYCYDALQIRLWRDKIFKPNNMAWQYFLLLVFVSSFVSFFVYSFWNILLKLEQVCNNCDSVETFSLYSPS